MGCADGFAIDPESGLLVASCVGGLCLVDLQKAEVVARLWTVGDEPGAGFRVSNVAFGLDAVYLTGDQGIWKLPLMLGRGMKHGEL